MMPTKGLIFLVQPATGLNNGLSLKMSLADHKRRPV